ncbi:class I SAM-dependent methyltransferase [Bremerella sp. T1]|uniref:class I SAM-dependent methyltransferase n=1 Tax=Bremerella sp. TYQ1 TaxID=3119568 RepID=UPI001CCA020A|nr:class I SAM-dependent methyltransferase [Bremerella volcania]UBM36650.1 class I SAM-dependent methyltransferase [Bremerella volcania]
MTQSDPAKYFNRQHAAAYDERWSGMAAINDAQHLMLDAVLHKLPSAARILCVGAGTGAELLSMASRHSQWQFIVVEPSAGMMEQCQKRASEAGITDRCTFHEGYLGTLPPADPFDAATSILVSHFFVNLEERRHYFTEIAQRLKPGGTLVTADLAADMASPEYVELVQHWVSLHGVAGIEAKTDHLGRDVGLLSHEETTKLLTSSGFQSPVLIYQALLIQTWVARRSADSISRKDFA